MKKITFTAVLFIIMLNNCLAQTTEQFSLANGDGWYRIIEQGGQGSGKIKISGISGSNRFTNLTMFVSLMAYNQGGSINIIENAFYNGNHVKEIRGGSINGKYVLDIYLEGIDIPTNISVTRDNNLNLLSSPIYNPSSNLSGKVEVSGKILGISSSSNPIYFSNGSSIGTITPTETLNVNGSILSKSLVLVDPLLGPNSDYTAIYREDIGNDNSIVKLHIGDDARGSFNVGYKLWSTGNFISTLHVNNNGNVGIGTINPDSKLSVNGNIHTKEVKVDLIGWSDFVFDKNYQLPSLIEVENHIKEKGHLKDIPSAEEVAKNGILLGEMDSKLLQKIEELTLYTIAQEKRLNEQETTIEKLKNENQDLKLVLARIIALEKKLDIKSENKID